MALLFLQISNTVRFSLFSYLSVRNYFIINTDVTFIDAIQRGGGLIRFWQTKIVLVIFFLLLLLLIMNYSYSKKYKAL